MNKNFKCGVTVAAMFFTVSLQAQELIQKVSFEVLSGSPLVRTLEDFATKTGFGLTYSKEDFKDLKVKNVKCESIPVNDCLQEIITALPVAFRMRGNLVSLKYKGSNAGVSGNGHLSGRIVNEVGEPVTGAVISVAGKPAVTDNNGDFSLNLPSGIHTLTVKAPKYSALRVEKLTVKANESNSVSFAMRPVSENETTIKEVVIKATRKADTQAGLLAQQKKAAQMSDGISAEQISKTPDSDVGGTLKRITGVTTVDNKYVVVRSMGERWNTAAMDGIALPSTEAYNNNFSFDIIPTAMVESVVVSKTATPDMNANFAGGYVEVRTKDIPNQDFLTVSLGNSFNTVSTFKEFSTRQRGQYDYFGYDDGTRDFPQNLELSDWNMENFFAQSKRFTQNNFTTFSTTADLGSNMQIALGKTFALKNNNKWGFAGAITTKNEQTKLDIEHTGRSGWLFNAFRNSDETPTEFFDFKNKGASYNYNSIVAGMLNFGVQLGKHRFSLRNSYTHTFDNSLTRITGWHEYSGSGNPVTAEQGYNFFYNGVLNSEGDVELPRTDETNYPVYQQLLQNKIEGSHKLGKLDFNWFAARTGVNYEMKDFTRNYKFYAASGDEIYAYYRIYNPTPTVRRDNIESESADYNYGADISMELNKNNFKNNIKAGYFGAVRENSNLQSSARLKVDENRPVPNSEKNYLNVYDLNELLDGTHYDAGGVGWFVPKYYGAKYRGKVTQHAPFLMFDHRLNTKWRLVWGARAEYYKYELLESQRENAADDGFSTTQTDDKRWQILPSANFTYSPTNKINVRLAYSKSAMRPNFQERTTIPFYDPVSSALVLNTGGLISSVADNYDFKFEWFPALGEIISFGLYHKQINDPIERVGFTTNEGNWELNVVNSKKAVLSGIEGEMRKSLGFIAGGGFLENLYISANATLNKTKITGYISRFGSQDSEVTYEADRPLYGQTPWAYNFGLNYDGERLGLNLVHNGKGDQYLVVGNNYKDEEIQRPYQTTDAQISYRMLRDKNLQFKLNVRNLFNTPIETYNNFLSYMKPSGLNPEEGNLQVRDYLILGEGTTEKFDPETDEILFRARNGVVFSFSVNYTF